MALNDGFCPSAVALKAQLLPLLHESDGSLIEGEQARVAAETAFEGDAGISTHLTDYHLLVVFSATVALVFHFDESIMLVQ